MHISLPVVPTRTIRESAWRDGMIKMFEEHLLRFVVESENGWEYILERDAGHLNVVYQNTFRNGNLISQQIVIV